MPSFDAAQIVNVIGYTRVSRPHQVDSGAGLAAQRAAISSEATRRGWQVVRWIEDAALSGKNTQRPGLQEALRLLGARRSIRLADGLVVSKLDRVSRSVKDFAELMETSEKQKWAFVALDLSIDTTTPSGEFMAHVVAALGRWERRIGGIRTSEALAERRAAGVVLGSPRRTPNDVVLRILAGAQAGQTPTEIGHALDADDIPTPGGASHWLPSSVTCLLKSEARSAEHCRSRDCVACWRTRTQCPIALRGSEQRQA
ncbi:MAG TPA: recombinase family protein [Candidatus Acidoferrum sp.]|jgi:DNA invertase Pin-like site-specific DNA recombinase|nr:recombinase family protein [Candidatus Acidoferrum sp.]